MDGYCAKHNRPWTVICIGFNEWGYGCPECQNEGMLIPSYKADTITIDTQQEWNNKTKNQRNELTNNKEDNKCRCCDYHGLEQGDTLYISSDWDGGIGFDYIRNIKYCPVCGKKLPETR